jgi:hypothetical protein
VISLFTGFTGHLPDKILPASLAMLMGAMEKA